MPYYRLLYGRQPPSPEDDAEHDFESLLGVMAANIEELRQCLVFEYEQRDAAAPCPAARGRSSSDTRGSSGGCC